MGGVYQARQTRLDRIVALKILSPEKQGNQKFAERFERDGEGARTPYQQASEVKTQVENVAATPEFRDSGRESAEIKNPGNAAPALPTAFSRTLMQFVTLGVAMLFACMLLLLAENSHAIPAGACLFRFGP